MSERRVEDEPGVDDPLVLEGDDDLPRQPQTTQDPYRPHMHDRPAWASRGKIFLWALLPTALIVAAVVAGHYY